MMGEKNLKANQKTHSFNLFLNGTVNVLSFVFHYSVFAPNCLQNRTFLVCCTTVGESFSQFDGLLPCLCLPQWPLQWNRMYLFFSVAQSLMSCPKSSPLPSTLSRAELWEKNKRKTWVTAHFNSPPPILIWFAAGETVGPRGEFTRKFVVARTVQSSSVARRHSRQSCTDCSLHAHTDALSGGMWQVGRSALPRCNARRQKSNSECVVFFEAVTKGQDDLASTAAFWQASGRLLSGRTRHDDQPQSFFCVCRCAHLEQR